jgi:hypothetical protein
VGAVEVSEPVEVEDDRRQAGAWSPPIACDGVVQLSIEVAPVVQTSKAIVNGHTLRAEPQGRAVAEMKGQ